MSPLVPNNSTTAGPEYSHIAQAKVKDLKSSYMKIIEVLKETIHKPLK